MSSFYQPPITFAPSVNKGRKNETTDLLDLGGGYGSTT